MAMKILTPEELEFFNEFNKNINFTIESVVEYRDKVIEETRRNKLSHLLGRKAALEAAASILKAHGDAFQTEFNIENDLDNLLK